MARNETIYTPIIKKVQEEMDAITDYISSGRPKNFEEYQRLVGKIEGLSIARELLQETEKRFIDDQGFPTSQFLCIFKITTFRR